MKLSELIREAFLPISADWQDKVEVGKTPFAHQIEDLKYMGSCHRCGIYNEPGVGKTLPIQAYGLWRAGNGNRVVYVMPPILIRQFSQSLDVNFVGARDFITCEAFNRNPAQRDKLWAKWEDTTFPNILLVSYVMFVKYYEALLEKGFNCVVVDEATAIKSPSSKIHKAVRAFAEDDNGVVLVTGTPIETNVEDAYGFIKIITPEAYGSYKNFEYHHVVKYSMFVPSSGKEVYKTQGYSNLEMLHDNLFRQARRVLKSEVSDLPPRLISEYLIDLSPKHMKLYNRMVNERMLEIGDELVDMTTAQSLYQAMQQVLLNPEKFGEAQHDNELFVALDAIIESLEGQKILVYAWFNASVDTICERYKHLNPAKINGSVTGDNRENEKQRFISDDGCKMLVANPKSGGVGIDLLQNVCSHMVYAEVCPFVGTFQQSMDRLHRTGQKSESVNVYILVANHTISVKLRNDLIKKDAYQELAMKDKRAILSDLLGNEGLKGSF